MAAFSESRSASSRDQLLAAFEQIVVHQTRDFVESVGKEFPDLNMIAKKLTDIQSIRKNISLIVLITYTRIYNKRPQGLELSNVAGKVDELANLRILIKSVAAGASAGRDVPWDVPLISAEAILTGASRTDAALHIHNLVKLLDQLHQETRQTEGGYEEDYEDAWGEESVGGKDDEAGEGEGVYFARDGFGRKRGGESKAAKGVDEYLAERMDEAEMPSSKGGVGEAAEGALEEEVLARRALHLKQRDARLRRAMSGHRRQQGAREVNARHAERTRFAKKVRQAEDLERFETGAAAMAEMERTRGLSGLLNKVLGELWKEMDEEGDMDAQHLQALEQQRISMTAAAGQLFSDRACMIAETAAERKAHRERMLKEQTRVGAFQLPQLPLFSFQPTAQATARDPRAKKREKGAILGVSPHVFAMGGSSLWEASHRETPRAVHGQGFARGRGAAQRVAHEATR
mmetsp:Transcript_29482/g.66068  ORF Transcript_29482/g.66068 Transcript_29482/m.66068 type:complete len:460 (+) Transcript_29482:127-1506(+)